VLTRLHVRGFKNLVDVDVRFGPFTCIAGPNGVGKSNLFDAILFLKDLATLEIHAAASRVRDPEGRNYDVRRLFHTSSSTPGSRMAFTAEFIAPSVVTDDFGRKAVPNATYLKYDVELELVVAAADSDARIELTHERLDFVRKKEAAATLAFPVSKSFLDQVLVRRQRTAPFISTSTDQGTETVSLHQDGGSRGNPVRVPARRSPRTVLAGINLDAQPTALAAKREMQSWSMLQLEPSALRRPDDVSADPHLSPFGDRIAATLHRLGNADLVATQLADLIPEVRRVFVDEDKARRLLTLMVGTADGCVHPARSLSDGTLRFLALSVLSQDPDAGRLFCLEEPENGIHPTRIKRILELLRAIAVDPDYPVDDQNPMRQVVINTHSPLVVSQQRNDDLVFCKSLRTRSGPRTNFLPLPGTWRAKSAQGLERVVSKGEVKEYLEEGREENEARRAAEYVGSWVQLDLPLGVR
jgi:predicted ATPase